MDIKRTLTTYFLVTGIPFSGFAIFAFWCGRGIHKNLKAGVR
jgi:hypothetical protein